MLRKIQEGFTLIELLVVMGIIAILAAITIVAINPARQFSQARDTQRRSDVNAIVSAVYQYAVDNSGNLPANFPTTATNIGTGAGNYDLTVTLVPKYLASIPIDPSTGSDGNTQYTLYKDVNGRVTVSAPGTEAIATPISVTR